MPRLPSLPKIQLRKLHSPTAQLVAAVLLMVGGGWLIGLWVVGIMLMLAGLGLGADALLRTDDSATRRSVENAHEDVLDRYRRAR